MNLPPIPSIPDVSDELIRTLNDRLRQIEQAPGGEDAGPAPKPSRGGSSTTVIIEAPPESTTPPAPNVVSATATVKYTQIAVSPAYQFQGVITVDDGAPEWPLTQRIAVIALGPDGGTARDPLLILTAPFAVTAHQISYETNARLEDTVAHSWGLEFPTENTSGQLTATPFTLEDINVNGSLGPWTPPPNIASINLAEAGTRTLDAVQVTHTTARVSGTLTDNHGANPVTVWLSFDGGVSWVWINWYFATGTSYSFDIDLAVNHIFKNGTVIKAAVYSGAIPRIDSLPAGAYQSGGIFFAGILAVGQVVTAATVSGVTYGPSAQGGTYWGLADVTYTITPDANFWTTQLYIRRVTAAGAVASDWQRTGLQKQSAGSNSQALGIEGGMYVWEIPGDSANLYDLKVTAINRNFVETQQNCWAGSANFIRIGPVVPQSGGGSMVGGSPVPPVTATACTLAELTRYQDNVQVTHANLRVSVTFSATAANVPVTVWLSFDGGVSWVWINWYFASGTSINIAIDVQVNYAFRSGATAKAAVFVGAIPSTATLPAGCAISAGVALAGLGTVAAIAATTGQISTPVLYRQNAQGIQWWGLDYVRFTIPGTDPSLWRVQLYVRKCNSAGTVAAPDSEGAWRPVKDAVQVYGQAVVVTWPIDFWNIPQDPAFAYYQFRVDGGTREEVYTTLRCWNGNTATASTPFLVTSQGATFSTVNIDPMTMGRGLQASISTGEMQVATDNTGNIILDAAFNGMVAGSLGQPGSQWGYTTHTQIIAGGGLSGPNYCRLTPTLAAGHYPNELIEQTVGVRPNEPYSIEAIVRGQTGIASGHAFYLQVYWYDATGAVIGSPAQAGFTYDASYASFKKVATVFTSPAGSAAAHIQFVTVYDDPGYWDVDSVKVFGLPDFTGNGQRTTMTPSTPSAGPGISTLSTFALADPSYYALTKDQLLFVATDGTTIWINLALRSVIIGKNPGNDHGGRQISLQLGDGSAPAVYIGDGQNYNSTIFTPTSCVVTKNGVPSTKWS